MELFLYFLLLECFGFSGSAYTRVTGFRTIYCKVEYERLVCGEKQGSEISMEFEEAGDLFTEFLTVKK